MPYPPGMSHSDFVRAGIVQPEDTEPVCPECDELIGRGGDHLKGCPNEGADHHEILEILDEMGHDEYNPADYYEP